MKRLRLFLLTPLLAFSVSCATIQRASATVGQAVEMLQGVRATVTQVLDRPAPLANTQVDENLIRSAYVNFDRGLTIIESLVDNNVIARNSPTALRIRSGILAVKRGLRRARTAQRIGNAPTVREALLEAQAALSGLITDVQRR